MDLMKQRYPDINFFLHRPLFASPPMLTLKEISDGSYSINDIALMHDIMDMREELKNHEQSR